jgi:hypothetical protein
MPLKNPPKPLPPVELLHERLRYDPVEGVLYWRKKTSGHLYEWFNKAYADKPVCTIKCRAGALQMKFCGELYGIHRLIWKMESGFDPLHIDHIDGDASNNRIENLRSVTPQDNLRNRRVPKNNKSGIIGVSKRHDGKWRAAGDKNGRTVVLGDFWTIEEAAAARRAYEKYVGYHKNHGRPCNPQDHLTFSIRGGV